MKPFLHSISSLLFVLILSGCKKQEMIFVKSIITTSGTRYIDEIFSAVDTSLFRVDYRIAKTYHSSDTTLKLNVYQPAGDTFRLRPAVVFIHGGGFSGGTEKDYYADSICSALARRGYVTISLGYRLGIAWAPHMSNADSILKQLEAAYRADQDARAAIRYIRKSSSIGRIDTTKMFIGGASAGAITSILLAYLNQDELSSDFVFRNGPLDGTGTYDYPGYATKVKGVINMEGVILDTTWIKTGDVPIFSYYGTADPFYVVSGAVSGSPFAPIFGGQGIRLRFNHLGIPNGIITYPGGVHGSVYNAVNIHATINSMSAAIQAQL
ncbi:alpha/beta hydrolase [Flavitalea sp. BT771]|uniref:alpha/beta hydrolase n=1 Tax=Flavitalea sp. BT771 TaxID=3063329 RepID=UPI0026E34317|nr:alpha/beta hydrolase [Flavitalea sp. BT771]MDO6431688.1 alpha/beta hydrolase [Flavitalea sp. BT771]MDV6220596.1 alpha/beta hydrolase [Flavitalea sp. BT771]